MDGFHYWVLKKIKNPHITGKSFARVGGFARGEENARVIFTSGTIQSAIQSSPVNTWSSTLLAGPYFIRAAHGPEPILEMPLRDSN